MRNWRPIVKMPGTSLSASKRVVGPRQAGLLAPDHRRWAPSQGLRLGGSRPRLPGYSDGFAPDSHRLPFSALIEPPIGVLYLSWRLAGITSPKGDRNYRVMGLSDARLLEVDFQLLDGRHPVDLLRLNVHELFLGREDEFDQVGNPDIGCVRYTEGAKLLNEVAGNDGPFGEVELFEPPQNPVQAVEAELALGVLGAGRDDSQRRALGLLLSRLVHRWGGSSDACRGWGQRPRYVPVPAASK